jgi:hypothetical protein
MNLEFLCPHCRGELSIDLSQAQTLSCRHCRQPVDLRVSDNLRRSGRVDACAVCGNERFYLQKDFNTRLGVIIFAAGVLLSYHTYFLSLLIATVIDFILYQVLKTVTVCYQCRAIYRDFEEDPDHRGFDPHLGMKYTKTAT